MTRRRDLMCEDIFGCAHEPEIPISDGGDIVEWRCRCGEKRYPVPAAKEGKGDRIGVMFLGVKGFDGEPRADSACKSARSLQASNVSCERQRNRTRARPQGGVIPSLPEGPRVRGRGVNPHGACSRFVIDELGTRQVMRSGDVAPRHPGRPPQAVSEATHVNEETEQSFSDPGSIPGTSTKGGPPADGGLFSRYAAPVPDKAAYATQAPPHAPDRRRAL